MRRDNHARECGGLPAGGETVGRLLGRLAPGLQRNPLRHHHSAAAWSILLYHTYCISLPPNLLSFPCSVWLLLPPPENGEIETGGSSRSATAVSNVLRESVASTLALAESGLREVTEESLAEPLDLVLPGACVLCRLGKSSGFHSSSTILAHR